MVTYSDVVIYPVGKSDFGDLSFLPKDMDRKKRNDAIDLAVSCNVLNKFLSDKGFTFVSYNSFREDGFVEKPGFDGFVADKNADIKYICNLINKDLSRSKYKSLSQGCRNWLKSKNIFICTITLFTITDKIRDISIFNEIRDYNKAIAAELIKKTFHRRSIFKPNQTVNDFYGFIKSVEDGKKSESEIIKLDRELANDFQISIGLDKRDNFCYLLSQIDKDSLVRAENFIISKGPGGLPVYWYGDSLMNGDKIGSFANINKIEPTIQKSKPVEENDDIAEAFATLF